MDMSADDGYALVDSELASDPESLPIPPAIDECFYPYC